MKTKTSSRKTEAPAEAVRAKATLKATDTNWRVIKLTETVRDNFKSFRNEQSLTNASSIDLLVDQQLPDLLSALSKLGIAKQEGKKRPARLPFSDRAVASLKAASNTTGIPAAMLFRCLLGNLPTGSFSVTPREAAANSSKKTAKTPKAAKTARRTAKKGAVK